MWSMDSTLSSKPSSRMPFPPGKHPQPPTAPTLLSPPLTPEQSLLESPQWTGLLSPHLTPEQSLLESPQWTPKPYLHMPGPSQWIPKPSFQMHLTPMAEPSFQWMPGPLQSVNHKSSYRMQGATPSRKSHSHPYLMSAMPRKVLQEVPDDGNRFRQPATLAELSVVNFVDKSSREKNYPLLQNALDRHLRMLRVNGIGIERKRAAVITTDQEAKLWEQGIIGFGTPQALLNAVFFYNGKKFCLRGVQEHQNLTFGQFERSANPNRYTYTEFGSKNRTGDVKDFCEGKVVSIIATGTHNCHVKLLDFYFSKVSFKLVAAGSKFYLLPLPFVPAGLRPWYFDSVLPLRTLQTLLKKMCQEAKFVGNFTNHSLRATGATTLFDAGVPEAIRQKRTGHKSIDARANGSTSESCNIYIHTVFCSHMFILCEKWT